MQDLPTWAYALISTIVSCALTTIVAFVIKRIIQKKADKQDHILELAKKQEEYEKKEDIKSIITGSIKPVVQHIEKIDGKLDSLKNENDLENKATVIMIRLKLMELHEIYMNRGYCDSKERASWEELFIKYGELGGNHFKEYMDEFRKDIQHLPISKQKKQKKTE